MAENLTRPTEAASTLHSQPWLHQHGKEIQAFGAVRQFPLGLAYETVRGTPRDAGSWTLETSTSFLSAHDFDCVALSVRRSMAIFGTMTPKLIAKMIVTAVMPSAFVAPKSSNVVCALLASCRRPLAILNRKTPGIIDTTDAKPMAANGI